MYKPNPIDTSYIQLSDDIMALSEMLAKNIHEIGKRVRPQNFNGDT